MLKHLQPPGQAGHGLFAFADGLKHHLEFSVQFGEASRCPLDKGQNPTLPLSDRRAGPHRAGAGDGEWAKPLKSPCQHWSSLATALLKPPHNTRRSRGCWPNLWTKPPFYVRQHWSKSNCTTVGSHIPEAGRDGGPNPSLAVNMSRVKRQLHHSQFRCGIFPEFG